MKESSDRAAGGRKRGENGRRGEEEGEEGGGGLLLPPGWLVIRRSVPVHRAKDSNWVSCCWQASDIEWAGSCIGSRTWDTFLRSGACPQCLERRCSCRL